MTTSLIPFEDFEEIKRPVKRLLSLLACSAALMLGCGGDGVGDPCAPQRPMNQPCTLQGDAGSSGCFDGREVYIETQSLQCRSRICLVYNYSETSGRDPGTRASRVYCTCRCGVPPALQSSTEQSVLCTCPDGFTCTSLAGDQYNPGVQGSYCVRSTTR